MNLTAKSVQNVIELKIIELVKRSVKRGFEDILWKEFFFTLDFDLESNDPGKLVKERKEERIHSHKARCL